MGANGEGGPKDYSSLGDAVMGGSIIRKGTLRGKQGWRAVMGGEGHSYGQRVLAHPRSPLPWPLQALLLGGESVVQALFFLSPPTISVWREQMG